MEQSYTKPMRNHITLCKSLEYFVVPIVHSLTFSGNPLEATYAHWGKNQTKRCFSRSFIRIFAVKQRTQ